MTIKMEPSPHFSRLVEIMEALRDKQNGCPWDLEQDFDSIKPYTIEEAYEVADAIDRKDFDDLKGELGDLLLQSVYHAQLAREEGYFDISDVVQSVTEKLIRRHPHVFENASVAGADGVNQRWEEIKKEERAARAAKRGADDTVSILDDVPSALPALRRAEKLSSRAAKVGFDWPNMTEVIAKCREELAEAEDALASGDPGSISEEIGDVLFAVANLARKAGVSAEAALYEANRKFDRRFRYVEARCAESGLDIDKAGLTVLDGFWNEIRARDKGE